MNKKILLTATLFIMVLSQLGYAYSTREINIKIINMSLSHRSIYIDPIYGDPTWNTEEGENNLSTVEFPSLYGSPGEQEIPYETSFAFDFQEELIIFSTLDKITQKFIINFISSKQDNCNINLFITTDPSIDAIRIADFKRYNNEWAPWKDIFTPWVSTSFSDDMIHYLENQFNPPKSFEGLSNIDKDWMIYFEPFRHFTTEYRDGEYYITLIFKGW